MAKIKNDPPLTRGQFLRVLTWQEISMTRAVFKDGFGEYVRLHSGPMYRNNRALTGRTGVVLGVVGGGSYREVHLDDGATVVLPLEILVRILATENKPAEYKVRRRSKARFKRFKGYMESNGIRKASGAAMVFT